LGLRAPGGDTHSLSLSQCKMNVIRSVIEITSCEGGWGPCLLVLSVRVPRALSCSRLGSVRTSCPQFLVFHGAAREVFMTRQFSPLEFFQGNLLGDSMAFCTCLSFSHLSQGTAMCYLCACFPHERSLGWGLSSMLCFWYP